jgi:orotidine-5'-phosphate decarboxylase
MKKEEITDQIILKKSYLCIGLDSDLTKLPKSILDLEDPVFEFNKQIIDATAPFCVAYKPNTAFYECNGVKGWESLDKTIQYLRKFYPNHFTIADAKRGDIGNTSAMYAKAFFENMNFDSVTIAPYMGKDSVTPFLGYKEKWVILLALTSNDGSKDFQELQFSNNEKLFEKVLKTSQDWATDEQMMYVVGATKAQDFIGIRKLVPEHFLLVPGLGAQGGNLDDVSQFGFNTNVGLLVNSSRAIIFASSNIDFAERAEEEARKVQIEMANCLEKYFEG